MTNIKLKTELEFIDEKNQSYAEVSLNPFFTWAKIIVTDDQPNANNHRIPMEEFDNIIRTGLFTPVKMDYGKISGHAEAKGKPLGTIAKMIKDGNKIVALAALWKGEREDVELLKEMYEKGLPPQVSWEVCYSDAEVDEKGIKNLKDVVLNGLVVVSNPAYAGRTPFVAIAEEELAEKWTREYINDLPDSAFLYVEPGGEKDEEGKTVPRTLRHLPYKDKDGNIDLPHLRNAIVRLSQPKTGEREGEEWLTEELRKKLLERARRILESQANIENIIEEYDELKQKVHSLEKELSEKNIKIGELIEYKNAIEAETRRREKLKEIKELFSQHGIQKDDTYFEENAEKFLSMDKNALEFLIQEMLAFKLAESSVDKGPRIPNIRSTSNKEEPTIKDLVEYLKKRR